MKDVIYQLTVEDVQNVSNQEIGRDLTSNEIEIIEEKIDEKIKWYDAIADCINEIIDIPS